MVRAALAVDAAGELPAGARSPVRVAVFSAQRYVGGASARSVVSRHSGARLEVHCAQDDCEGASLV